MQGISRRSRETAMKPKDVKRRKQMFAVLKHNILDDIKFQHATVDFQRTLGIVRKESMLRTSITITYKLGPAEVYKVRTWCLVANAVSMELADRTFEVVPMERIYSITTRPIPEK